MIKCSSTYILHWPVWLLLCLALPLLSYAEDVPDVDRVPNGSVEVQNTASAGITEEFLLEKVRILEETASSQKQKIEKLTAQLDATNITRGGMSFEEWAGVLLAAVTTLVAIMGVVIALFTFFGYRKIMATTETVAATAAEDSAKRTVESIIQETTRSELVRLFEDGRLDDFLVESAATVIYRGVLSRNHENSLDGDSEDQDSI